MLLYDTSYIQLPKMEAVLFFVCVLFFVFLFGTEYNNKYYVVLLQF